ncbi:MAG: hypothetical protein AMJ79_06110 [Phycisphaerae bacterium SM23_30]|nr:MAG: hypothetical protein AMJ79_06110 [Phycisphaerae bacterium SM23_30]
MKKSSSLLLLMVGVLMLMVLGCPPSDSKIEVSPPTYQPGQVEKVRFVRQDLYNSWVETPGQPQAMPSSREFTEEVVLSREVESVNSDGSMIMKVTFEQVNVTDKRKLENQENLITYRSTREKTESSEANEPALAGASYRIVLGPDTTVRGIMDLEQLRKELGIQEGASVIVARLLQENRLKITHEREFLQSGVQTGGQATKLFPVRSEWNKAQALEKTFRAQNTQTPLGHPGLAVTMTGQAVYILPEGWPDPPRPEDPIRPILIEKSDMQPPEITGESLLDLTTGQVLRDNTKTKLTLIITSEKIAQEAGVEKKETVDQQMFMQIELTHQFETLLN